MIVAYTRNTCGHFITMHVKQFFCFIIIINRCKTSSDVRCRDMGSEESTREDVGCGGNETVEIDVCSHQAGQN